MKTEDIPYDYTYCYATDEQCPKAVHCLCSHAARLNENKRSLLIHDLLEIRNAILD